MEDQEYIEPPPPCAERVARRALILSAIACRGFAENEKPEEAVPIAKDCLNWLISLGLDDDLSEWERALLQAPLGSLSSRDKNNASWLSEAVAVLAWSLGKADLPLFDKQCDPAGVANGLGFLQPAGETILNNPALLSPDELGDYNEFIYNLHWRLRSFSINKQKYDFESLARKAWGEPVAKYGLQFLEKDLSLGGVPITQAQEVTWRTVLSITQERHRASNWLTGYASEDFYEVTTDT
ncbi:protein of unknown function [Verrucomicrobium sp. GAS474]|uniref:DUF4272 domain-containing protein n=1 Tax=Verrucomicrobium sp. GAS474 TaxID=1882831 RepID=UPI00087A8247|nr:DUF4272 domain-containing protein [Verrucomicrobium sp. GAS474]SDT91564.1 protein of unknown function [Verrucomicrobium sp. GAS474]